MWRIVQLGMHISIRFHDDGRAEIVQTECSGHEVKGFKFSLTPKERKNLERALKGPGLPVDWELKVVA